MNTQAAQVADPYVGRVLGGRYKVLSKLGEGGIGAVYKGLQVNLEQAVAIKIMKPEVSANEVLVARFKNEARIYARIKSPYVVKIHDFGEEPAGPDGQNILYLVMEFLPGMDLRSLIRSEGPLPAARLCQVMIQVLEGLRAAHDLGIVHRDVKPANVMIQGAETAKPFARVLDFGVSKVDAEPLDAVPENLGALGDDDGFERGLTLPGAFSGTPVYMSPEQCRSLALDHRSDIYAAGVLMYELASARTPFTANSALAMLTKHVLEVPQPPSTANPQVRIPHALEDIIMRCLEKQPDDRYPSTRELIEDLQSVASDVSNPDLVPLLDLHQRFSDMKVPVSTRSFGMARAAKDPETSAAVREVLRTLGMAYKNFVTYPRDSPIFRGGAESLYGLLERYFRLHPRIELTVDRFAVLFGGERVYEDTDMRGSLPFKLFSDGIRTFSFQRGVDRRELGSFLECLHEAATSPALAVDLVTLLWERRFQHIQYQLVEDLVAEGLPDGGQLLKDQGDAPDSPLGLGGGTVHDRIHATSATSMEPSPAETPVLDKMTPEELDALTALVEEAEAADDTDEFVRAVLEALGRADGEAETSALVQVLDSVAAAAMQDGDVPHLLTILNPVRRLLQNKLPEQVAEGLRSIIANASQPHHVSLILDQIKGESSKEKRQEIASALSLLDPSVVDTILRRLDQFDDSLEIPALQLALLMHCRDSPERLAPGLSSARPRVVRAAIRIVRETGSAAALQLLEPTVDHPHPSVKLEAIQALVKLRSPRLVQRLEPLLDDEDARVRVAVMAAWAEADPDSASRPLLSLVEDERFVERPQSEKATVFRVLGRLGGKDVLRAMERVLFAQPRGWARALVGQMTLITAGGTALTAGLIFSPLGTAVGLAIGIGITASAMIWAAMGKAAERNRHSEFVEPAAMCLRQIGTPEAMEVLKDAAVRGPVKTRRICNRVIKIAASAAQ